MYVCIYIYMYIYIYMCVCVCVCLVVYRPFYHPCSGGSRHFFGCCPPFLERQGLLSSHLSPYLAWHIAHFYDIHVWNPWNLACRISFCLFNSLIFGICSPSLCNNSAFLFLKLSIWSFASLKSVPNVFREWESHLVGGLEHEFYFSIYWEIHRPNWLSYFSEGPTTNQIIIFLSVP